MIALRPRRMRRAGRSARFCGVASCLALLTAAPSVAADELPLVPAPQQQPSGAPAEEPPARGVERLSDEQGRTHWSKVRRSVSVRDRPSRASRKTGALRRYTYYGQTDIVLALAQSGNWIRVRYSGLGSRTGWVPASALTRPRLTRTWVVIDKRRKVITAYRGKKRLMRARVGIGAKGSPTPGGRFFIRERLVPQERNGIYGKLALGISAYSRHRTDWPGGGQVGIHGTNQPGLIPGRISNGCVRLRNADIVRLGRIVDPGTPVRIR